jgi:Tfp pilus assembly protein PilF
MSIMDRIEMLRQFLVENPGDSFARYGLAMEYSKAGDVETALREFRAIVESNPDYVPAYQMAAQMLSEHQRTEEARQWFTQGIEAARRSGNGKAESEMAAMLDLLG